MGYQILIGDVLDRLASLPDNSVHCVVTSPPYYRLRDYGVAGQIGLEATPAEFLAKLTAVFREVRRVLRPDGSCWVNMGDSYNAGTSSARNNHTTLNPDDTRSKQFAERSSGSIRQSIVGLKPKDLMGMPWRLAFALQDDGWWLRQDIIWSKPNPMPESVTDRCTKAHEYIFLLTKSARYFYDADAIREAQTSVDKSAGRNSSCLVDKSPEPRKGLRSSDPDRFGLTRGTTNESCTHPAGRNKRSVWEIPTEAFPEAHFATYPTKLVEPCILAGTSEKGSCEACGAPWVRQVERDVSFQSGSGRSGNAPSGKHAGGTQEQSGAYDIRMGPVTSTGTIGWQASCSCGAETVPCTVLDPFNGSGTTGLVALRHRCRYIGIELNPEYAAMAERRLAEASSQLVLL